MRVSLLIELHARTFTLPFVQKLRAYWHVRTRAYRKTGINQVLHSTAEFFCAQPRVVHMQELV